MRVMLERRGLEEVTREDLSEFSCSLLTHPAAKNPSCAIRTPWKRFHARLNSDEESACLRRSNQRTAANASKARKVIFRWPVDGAEMS